jgi:hypothetical protein
MAELGEFGKFTKGLVIKQHSRESLRLRLMHSIALYQGEKSIAPPEMLVKTMVHAHDHKVPILTGLAENPFVDPRGRLVTGNGYNKDTGLYFSVSASLPDSFDANNLTISNARRALRYIECQVFAEFPFETPLDRAGAVAMMLTALERHMIHGDGGCPGFLVNAPGQGTGKTTLVQLTSLSVFGRAVPATTWTNDDKELAKHILAVLMEGRPIVLFDNLPEGSLITSDELSKATTNSEYQGRRLGDNVLVDAPTTVTWVFTGNNVTPTGDFNTRLLQIRLDAKEERPDRRNFKRKRIARWCAARRPKILRALLTIVLVGLKQDSQRRIRDKKYEPTRFQGWDQMVRYPMLLAGSEDPAELFEKNRAEDPRTETHVNFLRAWYEWYGDKWIYLSDLIKAVDRVSTYEPASSIQPFGLKDAIKDMMPRGNVTASSLGTFIRRFRGRKLEGFTLQQQTRDTKSNEARPWRVISDHPREKEAEEYLDLSIDLDDE